jgi:hypothetical protein
MKQQVEAHLGAGLLSRPALEKLIKAEPTPREETAKAQLGVSQITRTPFGLNGQATGGQPFPDPELLRQDRESFKEEPGRQQGT